MDLSKLKFAELPEELVTGVDTIDRQHAALITIVNHLLASAQEGEGKIQLQNIMSFLNSYVETHFTEEEKYMRKYKYPEYESHYRQHQYFKRFVKDLNNKIHVEKSDPMLHIKAIKVIKDWLINHVIKVDMLLANFLKNQKN